MIPKEVRLLDDSSTLRLSWLWNTPTDTMPPVLPWKSKHSVGKRNKWKVSNLGTNCMIHLFLLIAAIRISGNDLFYSSNNFPTLRCLFVGLSMGELALGGIRDCLQEILLANISEAFAIPENGRRSILNEVKQLELNHEVTWSRSSSHWLRVVSKRTLSIGTVSLFFPSTCCKIMQNPSLLLTQTNSNHLLSSTLKPFLKRHPKHPKLQRFDSLLLLSHLRHDGLRLLARAARGDTRPPA